MKEKKYKVLEKLKGLLREKKYSYKKISALVGINYTTFSNKINGYSAFTLIEATKLIEILQISKDKIYEYFF